MPDAGTRSRVEVGRAALTNGHRDAGPPQVGILPPRGRVHLPTVAIGAVVVIGCALLAVLVHLSTVEKVPVLSAARPIERGETISADDLRVVYISSGDNFARMSPSETDQVVGQIVVTDIASGQLLSAGLIDETVLVAEDSGVVGLLLEPGQYPALGLAPGDRVNVIRSVQEALELDGGDDAAESSALQGSEVTVATEATVWAVEELGSDRQLVSITANRDDAATVASLADAGTLRLVLVAP